MEFAVIPSLQSGVTPEFEVTPEPVACIHSWSPESGVTTGSGVEKQSEIWRRE